MVCSVPSVRDAHVRTGVVARGEDVGHGHIGHIRRSAGAAERAAHGGRIGRRRHSAAAKGIIAWGDAGAEGSARHSSDGFWVDGGRARKVKLAVKFVV